jgi:hypothetical protein
VFLSYLHLEEELAAMEVEVEVRKWWHQGASVGNGTMWSWSCWLYEQIIVWYS